MTPDDITDLLLDWIDSEKEKGNKGSTIASKICAAETFFEMNCKIWHSKLVRRFIPNDETEPSEKLPVTDKELQVMPSLTNDLRSIALIHFFCKHWNSSLCTTGPNFETKTPSEDRLW